LAQGRIIDQQRQPAEPPDNGLRHCVAAALVDFIG
jgi:hypothetical protein